jgi:alpha-L-fucosidase
LKVNGEAIYGTRPWKVYGEGPTQVVAGAFNDTNTRPYTPEDFRFTTKGDVLYAIELGWPAAKHETVIHSIQSGVAGEKAVASVELLGSAATLPFESKADGLHIQIPEQAPGSIAYAFRFKFAGK